MRLEKVIKTAILESIDQYSLFPDNSIEAKARRLIDNWAQACMKLGPIHNKSQDVIFKDPELFKEFTTKYYNHEKIGLNEKELDTAMIIIESWGYFLEFSIRSDKRLYVEQPVRDTKYLR